MKTTRRCVSVLWLTVIAVGCNQPAPQDANIHDDLGASRLVSVVTLQAEPTELARTTTQPATVHAWHEARIFAKASGYVSDLRVDIGSKVSAGEVLAVLAIPEIEKQVLAKEAMIEQLTAEERRAEAQVKVAEADSLSYAARLNRAKAEVGKSDAALAAANVELQRVRDLVQQRAVADRLLDESTKRHEAILAERSAAEAAVASAEAELTLTAARADAADAELAVAKAATKVAREQLDELTELMKYAEIKSPLDGIVSERNIDLGELIRNAQNGASDDSPPLLVVTQLDKVRVQVAVPERDAPLADAGDPATITLQALPGEVFEGTVSRTTGVLAESSRTLMLEIDLENPDGKLMPGMFGQATIVLDPAAKRLTLPAPAVRFDGTGNSYVYVVNESSEIDVVSVQTGLDDGIQIEITAGLDGAERIVGPLLRRLKAGQKVTTEG